MKQVLKPLLLFKALLLANNSYSHSPYSQIAHDFIAEVALKYEVIDSFSYYNQEFIARHKPVWQYGVQVRVKPYRAQIHFFEYKDSISTDVAFAAMMSNFPNYGGPLTRCKDMRGIISPPVVYLVGQNSITILEQRCEEELSNMEAFRKLFLERMNFKIYYQLEVGCGGPVRWVCP